MGTSELMKFSLFYDVNKGIFSTAPIKEITIFKLIEIYKSDLVKDISNQITEADEATKKHLKKQLPFITPYGTFNPTRCNVDMASFNSSLLCLDIDGLKENEVHLVKCILSSHISTLLCAVSPRKRGVKALIILGDTIPQQECYNTLKLNKTHIAERLGLSQFVNKIDEAQFKPTQPWFISYDEELYTNTTCKALNIDLIPYSPPVREVCEVDFNLIQSIEQSNFKEPINYRVQKYFESATNNLVKFFACCGEGQRHSSIIKVQTIASWIHYAPGIEDEVKRTLYNACCDMYGSHKEAMNNNVLKSFERAWNTAPIRQNLSIENILSDSKYTSINQQMKSKVS